MSEKQVARRNSRILALQTLFYLLERDMKISVDKAFEYTLKEVEEREADEFSYQILTTAIENLPKIKVLVRAFASDFAFEKIASINKALLILGISEMKFMETPPVVVINEYIELSKEFGEEKSAGFINGVLDAYRKSLGLDRKKS